MTEQHKMKIGILTGGGDCCGLNAAIRAITLSLIHDLDADVWGIEEGFRGLIEKKWCRITEQEVEDLIDKGGTMLRTCNNASPFNFDGRDASAELVDNVKAHGFDAIVALGGDGTMSLCFELSKLGIRFVGVPKTIDNDLAHTDRTFGFETAVNVVVDAIDRLRTTGRSHNRVMILETMGRYAGWIALHAGVAGGADVILLPEFDYDLSLVLDKLQSRSDKLQPSIIVIAEGAKPLGGQLSISKTVTNSPDAIRLGGIGNQLQAAIEAALPVEVRTTVLGHIQRGGTTSPYDRIFASNVGCYATSLIACNRFGRMVTVENNHLSSIPLESVAHAVRNVPKNDMTLISALSMGICLGAPNLKLPLKHLCDGSTLMG